MSTGASQKRISKELATLSQSPPANLSVSLLDESDLHKWHITLLGPSGTPFADGVFHITLTLPPTYPFKPPVINFNTKIYHPNVSNESPPNSGMMCLGMLRDSEWKPSTKMEAVLDFLMLLMREPDPDDAVEMGIAEMFKRDRPSWEREAREWTRRYATGDGKGEGGKEGKKK